MLRVLALLAIPVWSVATVALLRTGGRRLAWGVTCLVALSLAAWAGSRVGTANPISRTARWDPWLMFVMMTVLLAVPGAGVTWGVVEAAGRPMAPWAAVVAGTLGGLLALPVAFAAAVMVEVLWPH